MYKGEAFLRVLRLLPALERIYLDPVSFLRRLTKTSYTMIDVLVQKIDSVCAFCCNRYKEGCSTNSCFWHCSVVLSCPLHSKQRHPCSSHYNIETGSSPCCLGSCIDHCREFHIVANYPLRVGWEFREDDDFPRTIKKWDSIPQQGNTPVASREARYPDEKTEIMKALAKYRLCSHLCSNQSDEEDKKSLCKRNRNRDCVVGACKTHCKVICSERGILCDVHMKADYVPCQAGDCPLPGTTLCPYHTCATHCQDGDDCPKHGNSVSFSEEAENSPQMKVLTKQREEVESKIEALDEEVDEMDIDAYNELSDQLIHELEVIDEKIHALRGDVDEVEEVEDAAASPSGAASSSSSSSSLAFATSINPDGKRKFDNVIESIEMRYVSDRESADREYKKATTELEQTKGLQSTLFTK